MKFRPHLFLIYQARLNLRSLSSYTKRWSNIIKTYLNIKFISDHNCACQKSTVILWMKIKLSSPLVYFHCVSFHRIKITFGLSFQRLIDAKQYYIDEPKVKCSHVHIARQIQRVVSSWQNFLLLGFSRAFELLHIFPRLLTALFFLSLFPNFIHSMFPSANQ